MNWSQSATSWWRSPASPVVPSGPAGPGLALVVDVLLLPMAARYTCTLGEEASVSCLLGMNKSRPLCSGQGPDRGWWYVLHHGKHAWWSSWLAGQKCPSLATGWPFVPRAPVCCWMPTAPRKQHVVHIHLALEMWGGGVACSAAELLALWLVRFDGVPFQTGRIATCSCSPFRRRTHRGGRMGVCTPAAGG